MGHESPPPSRCSDGTPPSLCRSRGLGAWAVRASRPPVELRRRQRGLARSGCAHSVSRGGVQPRGPVVRRHLVIPTARPRIGALDVRAARASMASAELRRYRRCLARFDRIHLVRGRLLQRTDHQVRRHEVVNTPNPKTAPHRHQLQSSSTRLQPCTKSRRRAGLGLSAHFWYRARVTGMPSPPPGHAGVEIAFSHHRVTGNLSILRSRLSRRVACSRRCLTACKHYAVSLTALGLRKPRLQTNQ